MALRGSWNIRQRTARYGVPVLLLLACTLPHLDQGDFRRDSARYAAVSLQMIETPPWWLPRLHEGAPYFRKPPLPFWIHGVFLKAAGAHVWSARLPSVLAAAGCVVVTVALIESFGGRLLGFTAGCVLATTYEFFRRTREISLDLWMLLFLLLAVWLLCSSLLSGRWWRLVAAGMALGLSLLCKPFVTFVGMFPCFALRGRKWGAQKRRWMLGLMVLVAVVVAGGWYTVMTVRFGWAFWRIHLVGEIVDRVRGVHGAFPCWYYAAQIARTYWPWLPFLALGVSALWKESGVKPRRAGLQFALLWLAVWMTGLSIFMDKAPNYELPLYPMAAWVAAHGLCRLKWRWLARWRGRCAGDLAWAALVLLVALSALPLHLQAPPSAVWREGFDWMARHQVASDRIWGIGFPDNDSARFYLRDRKWARTPDEDRQPGAGDLLFYHPESVWRPGANETIEWQREGGIITKLRQLPWQPQQAGRR